MQPRRILLKLLGALTLTVPAVWAQAPVLFFSDITSGPNTGGENGNGAYVTIYGNYFGASQGGSTATAGGGVMVNCKNWGAASLWYQKLTCQLGPGATSGNLVVTVNGLSSNPLPFAVTAGNIYFVSAAGSDNNPGSFASPWGTLLNARNVMQLGDITYAMNGVTQSTDDGTGWDSAFLLSGGNQGNWCSASGPPRALVAYPGATVTIGNPSGGLPDWGLRTSDCQGNWVFSGISFRGQIPGGPFSGSHYRFSGSDITCPYTQGSGGSACFETSQASYIYFYGNHVYDAGTANASAEFQGVYFSTDTNYVDMGWNLVENVHGCRGVQVHSSPLGSGGPTDPTGYDQYAISIHDNTIHDTQCDGIIVDTVDPSHPQGPVSIYNNVVYNAGQGPANPENTGGWNCINIPGSTENGPTGSGTVEIFNNTLFTCGTFTNPPYPSDNTGIAENGYGTAVAPIYIHSRNNLIYSVATSLYPAGVPYFVVWNEATGGLCADTDDCKWLYGTNNLLYGAGAPVTDLTEIVRSVNANPQVVSTSLPDLHLTSGSPANQAGSAIGNITVFGIDNTGNDHDGLPRPAIPAIGAYEIAHTAQTPVTVKSATAGQIEPLAADSIVSAYGANLAAGIAQATLPLGTTLDGTTVTVTDSAGGSRPALLFYVSPTQINFVIPDGTAPGAATVTVTNKNGISQTSAIRIGAVSPGLFELNPSGLVAAWVLPVISGAAQNLQAVYKLNSTDVVPLPVSLGPASEQVYLEMYGTGIRNAKDVRVTVSGVSVPVLYSAAAPGFAGEDQVNIGPLPQSLVGHGSVNILLTADGQAANTVNVTIQ